MMTLISVAHANISRVIPVWEGLSMVAEMGDCRFSEHEKLNKEARPSYTSLLKNEGVTRNWDRGVAPIGVRSQWSGRTPSFFNTPYTGKKFFDRSFR